MAKRRKIKRPLWLDWDGGGYFAIPFEPLIPFPKSIHDDPVLTWVSAFQHAQRGIFSHVPKIPEIVYSRYAELSDQTCAYLIGDAGPSSMFPPLVDFITSGHWNFELIFEWCEAISTRGRLGDVPALMDAFEANVVNSNDDHEIILLHISEIIEDGSDDQFSLLEGYANIAEYRTRLHEHCDRLLQRFGSEDVLLWRGEPTSVRHMAQQLLGSVQAPLSLPTSVRQRFEASTGIDCTTMFDRRGNFLPMQAAAIAEVFLDSPASQQYVDGARYFFGHPIP